MGNMPVYKVTTTGRTSGQPRTVMLTAPVRDGDTFVFVASKGGDHRDPDWYRNMVANPEFTIEPTDGSSPTTWCPDGVRRGESRALATDRLGLQGLRRVSAQDRPGHPRRGG